MEQQDLSKEYFVKKMFNLIEKNFTNLLLINKLSLYSSGFAFN